MTVDRAIARFRSRQVSLFRDQATVTRSVGDESFDPVTGEPEHATTVVYSGACLLRGLAWEGSDRGYGDTEVRLRGVRAKFPVDTPIRYGDVITPTASTFDQSLVGVSYRVTDVIRDGWQISRVVIAEEIFES